MASGLQSKYHRELPPIVGEWLAEKEPYWRNFSIRRLINVLSSLMDEQWMADARIALLAKPSLSQMIYKDFADEYYKLVAKGHSPENTMWAMPEGLRNIVSQQDKDWENRQLEDILTMLPNS